MSFLVTLKEEKFILCILFNYNESLKILADDWKYSYDVIATTRGKWMYLLTVPSFQ